MAKEEKKVKGNDPVTVYATEKNTFYSVGDAMVVHSNQAEKLVASGKATKEAPKAEK